ncbi:MAG TPA: DUF3667 domain-containing protein [Permianibacter sp.]|nr:DUF3667 domain-containing protein [Permianibacter sp.]
MDSSSQTSGHCANCAAAVHGPFCQQCGLRHQQGQLSMRQLGADARNRLLEWERGFFRTCWHLLRQPRTVLERVLSGQRQGYNHPLTFLLICATVSLLSIQLYDDAFWRLFADDVRARMQAAGRTSFDAEHAQRFIAVYSSMMALLPYWMMLQTLPSAWLSRWFFPRRGHTVAEFWVLHLYAVGVALLLDAALSVALTLLALDTEFRIRQSSAGILILLCFLYVGRAWLRGGLWTLLRLAAAMLLVAIVASVLQQTLAFSYAYWGGGFR